MADDESGHSEEKLDFFGQPYTQHYDGDGNPSGHTEEKKDFFDQPYTQHYDEAGNPSGHTEEKKDFFDQPYSQNYDENGDPSGHAEKKKDFFDKPYTEHHDASGEVTGYSEWERDFLGKPYVSHHGLGAQPRAHKNEAPPERQSPVAGESEFGGGGYEGPSAPRISRPLSPIGVWEAALYASAFGALIGRLSNGILGELFLWGGQGLLGFLGFGIGVKAAFNLKGPEYRNGGGFVAGLALIIFSTYIGVQIASSIDQAAPGIWGPLFGGGCFGLVGLFRGPNILSNLPAISVLPRLGLVVASFVFFWVALRGGFSNPDHSSSKSLGAQTTDATPPTSRPIEQVGVVHVKSRSRVIQRPRISNASRATAIRDAMVGAWRWQDGSSSQYRRDGFMESDAQWGGTWAIYDGNKLRVQVISGFFDTLEFEVLEVSKNRIRLRNVRSGNIDEGVR